MAVTYDIIKKAQDVTDKTIEIALAPSLTDVTGRCFFKLAVGSGADGIYGITQYGRLTGNGYDATDTLTITLYNADDLTFSDGVPVAKKTLSITVGDLLSADLDTALTDSV